MTTTSLSPRQRGVATLTVVLLLLSLMALVVLFANRSLLLEHRSSANQLRAAIAAQAAEAGLDWAMAMLNQPRPIDANCLPTAAGMSFSERYAPADATGALVPTGARTACRLGGNGLVCSCPSQPGQNPSVGASDDPSFAVTLETVAGDAAALRLTAWGCTAAASPCLPGATQRADATARAAVLLKARPLLRAVPSAAITAGGNAVLGAARVSNLDVTTQGQLVLAGGSIDASGATLATLPGSPALNALGEQDGALARRLAESADGSALFNAFFGMNAAHFRQAVRVVAGSSAAERASALRVAYDQGHTAFWVEGDLSFDAAEIGTTSRPVLIVTANRIGCSVPCVVRGLLYADVTARDPSDLAGVDLRGAVVTRGQHAQAADSAVTYDGEVLTTLRRRTAAFARVPGSWHDD